MASAKGKQEAALEPRRVTRLRDLARKRAVIIGIDYRSTPNQLEGCASDANNMAEMLKRFYNFTNDNVLVMTEAQSVTRPTKANIMDAMRWLLSTSPASDFGTKRFSGAPVEGSIFYLHYSGHGVQVPDANHDEKDGKDEAIVPVDYLKTGLITDDVIRTQLIQRIPIGCKLYATMDCCHSATVFDLRWNVSGLPVPTDYQLTVDEAQLETPGQTILLSACRDAETDAEVRDGNRSAGALTKALITVLAANYYNLSLASLLTDVAVFFNSSNLRQVPNLSLAKSSPLSIKWMA